MLIGLAMAGDAAAAEEAMTLGPSLLFQRYGKACPTAVNRAVEFLQAHAGGGEGRDLGRFISGA